jgi:hypothetical protein
LLSLIITVYMKSKTVIAILILFCISSKFSSAQNRFNYTHRCLLYKSPLEELITRQEWVLAATGFDDNNDSMLDASEEAIEDSHKGNSYFFNADGTCTVYDNSLSCDSSPAGRFNWRLRDNDTKIEIGSVLMSILRVNENEMVLSPFFPTIKLKFIMVYRR